MGKQDHPFQGTVLLSDWFQLHTHRRREFSAQESNSNRQCRKLRLGDDPTSFNPCMQMQTNVANRSWSRHSQTIYAITKQAI